MHETFATLHMVGAISAYITAFVIFTQRVGGRGHRMIGIGYAVAMLTTALSGFGLYNFGHPSIFHVFSVITIVSVSRGWYAIYQYRATQEKSHLMNHYFNMAYSFMGLNLASIAQAMRFFTFESLMEYFSVLAILYLVAITIANRLIQDVYFKRFSGWFGVRAAE